jgi:LCP family protein required for cell wall assembly
MSQRVRYSSVAESRVEMRRRRMWRALGWISVFLCVGIVATSLSAYAMYRKLGGNIHQQDVADKLGNNRPDTASEAENILLLGSDTREAKGTSQYGNISGARSDTVILLHLSPKRDRALLISFPRDSWVDIPSCEMADGSTSAPTTNRINVAFSTGGPACTWKTIESLTGIHIDHFVMVNFAGFKNVINALGGVEVCLPEPVQDPKSRLNLSAGHHTVMGEQALAYVRTRTTLGDGSDLDRINRQQAFLASAVHKATSTRLLFNPPRLYNVLNAATKSITTDSELSMDGLRNLALSVRGLDAKNVKFATVPVYTRPDGATVAFQQPYADELFEAIQNDNRYVPKKSRPDKAKPVPASQVRVRVLNGTNVTGLAAQTAEELTAAGFKVVGVGNADTDTYQQSVVRHGPSTSREASTVARTAIGAEQETDPELGKTVDLILGANWDGVNEDALESPKQARKLPAGVDQRNAAQGPCTGAS